MDQSEMCSCTKQQQTIVKLKALEKLKINIQSYYSTFVTNIGGDDTKTIQLK